MNVTPAMFIQWLSETGRYDPERSSFNWRDFSDDEKLAFLKWVELHQPDKAELDGGKGL